MIFCSNQYPLGGVGGMINEAYSLAVMHLRWQLRSTEFDVAHAGTFVLFFR